MFGILRLLIGGAREAIQERSAKNRLEGKLGRKVSKAELYSLGSHLDAAQPTVPPPYASPNAAAPAANARPLLTTTRVVVALGILFVLFVTVGTAALFVMLPERTLNRYSPFTPSPPAGSFPAQVGAFKRGQTPDYTNEDYTVKIGPRFESVYSSPASSVTHSIWAFGSDAEARTAFEAKKKYFKNSGYAIPSENDSRFVSAWRNSDVRVIWLAGAQLREIKAYTQKTAYEFEAALNNSLPAEVVEIKDATKTPAANENSVTVLQLLDEYKKDQPAADKKYKDKIVSVSGKVEVSEKDKKGNWMIAFLRPGSTNPADGMVVCSFDKSKESSVSSIKKGDTVTLQGKVAMFLVFSVMLENCSKP